MYLDLIGLSVVVRDIGVLVVVVNPFLTCCSRVRHLHFTNCRDKKKLTGQLITICSEKIKTVPSLVNGNVKNSAGASEKGNVAVRVVGVVVAWDGQDVSNLFTLEFSNTQGARGLTQLRMATGRRPKVSTVVSMVVEESLWRQNIQGSPH